MTAKLKIEKLKIEKERENFSIFNFQFSISAQEGGR
jgi:hypothetical protein